MCAIYGWLSSASTCAAPELHKMGRSLSHRGPDDQGSFFDCDGGLALGHNRLSIIDLSSSGHQPMFNEDRTNVLVFNGEIYNFQRLRHELQSAGHVFTSRSDSEVIVHGYEEWGQAVVDKLIGMFAFAIWDVSQQSLFLARDPMGIKPLYYWRSPAGTFYFASEIKAFLVLNEFRPRPNRRMLRQFLEMNFLFNEHETSLEEIYKLPAGSTLTIRRNEGTAEPRRYYSPPSTEPATSDEAADSRATRLYDVLDDVVRQHMMADVPVGVLLSGGLDSSVIASLATRHAKVRTISMAFADSEIDERPFARTVSEYIRSEHEEVIIRPEEIAADLESAVWYIDDLFGDWGLISTMLLYKKCRAAGVKVVLVGEGSDELFGGYPNFDRCGGEGADRVGFFTKTLRLYQWFSGRRWGRELWRFGQAIRQLYDVADGDYFATVRLFETRRQLPHHYNMKVDKASMAASVEARVPFLDVRVAEEGYRAPRGLLLRNGMNKWLLRRVAERYKLIPPAIAQRPKFGASMAANWMDTVPIYRDFARQVILDPSGMTAELGLRPAMLKYFEDGHNGYRFPRGLSIFSIVAWRLLLLNLWARHYCHSHAVSDHRIPSADATHV